MHLDRPLHGVVLGPAEDGEKPESGRICADPGCRAIADTWIERVTGTPGTFVPGAGDETVWPPPVGL